LFCPRFVAGRSLPDLGLPPLLLDQNIWQSQFTRRKLPIIPWIRSKFLKKTARILTLQGGIATNIIKALVQPACGPFTSLRKSGVKIIPGR
jgi:hypothetical protein